MCVCMYVKTFLVLFPVYLQFFKDNNNNNNKRLQDVMKLFSILSSSHGPSC